MRLTLIIATIGAGGAERVLSHLANTWAQKGWEITLFSFDDGSEPPFYELHSLVHHIPLGLNKKSRNPFVRLKNIIGRTLILRRAIIESRPNAVISFIDENNVRVLLSTIGLSIPVIVNEQNHPFCEKISFVWDLLRRWLYRRAAAVVVLTPSAIPYFSSRIQKRIKVIPNPAAVQKNDLPVSKANKNGNRKLLIAMGRLTEQKGFDFLLQAFAKISHKHPDWSLVIWGEGPQRAYLENMKSRLGLNGRVEFPGLTKQPYEQFAQADLFVLSSRWEGFVMVLLEAMACGLPAVSFDCPTSPREIIRDGTNGILVPPENVDALSEGMNRLMENDAERKRMASRASEILERYGMERIAGMWESVIQEVVPHG